MWDKRISRGAARAAASVVLPFAIVLAVVALGTAGAAGTDRDAAAKTKLTIESWPEGLFGILSSGQAGKCARDRRVVIFNQSGRRQNPAQDDRVGVNRTDGGIVAQGPDSERRPT